MIYGKLARQLYGESTVNAESIESFIETTIANDKYMYQECALNESGSLIIISEANIKETVKNVAGKIQQLIKDFIEKLKQLWQKFLGLFKKKKQQVEQTVTTIANLPAVTQQNNTPATPLKKYEINLVDYETAAMNVSDIDASAGRKMWYDYARNIAEYLEKHIDDDNATIKGADNEIAEKFTDFNNRIDSMYPMAIYGSKNVSFCNKGVSSADFVKAVNDYDPSNDSSMVTKYNLTKQEVIDLVRKEAKKVQTGKIESNSGIKDAIKFFEIMSKEVDEAQKDFEGEIDSSISDGSNAAGQSAYVKYAMRYFETTRHFLTGMMSAVNAVQNKYGTLCLKFQQQPISIARMAVGGKLGTSSEE